MNTYYIFTVLIFVICILLTLIVLVQNSKGGGLASNFSSSNQVMGVRKTADFLEKGTWYLAIGLLAFSLATAFVIPRNNKQTQGSDLTEQVEGLAPVNYQAPAQEGQAQPAQQGQAPAQGQTQQENPKK
ncbi:MAG: preprotein translocase subunit SecG [Bacteroidota bacterium]